MAKTTTNGFDMIKNKVETENHIDTEIIIEALSVYTQKDLRLFRDCIDFILIFKK